MFRYSASRFHGYELMDQVRFCNFLISHARKLVDGSNESDTPSSYPTDTGTLWVSALVFELGSYGALKLDFEVLFFKYFSSTQIIKENKTSRLDGNLLEWMHLSPNVATQPGKYWRGSLYLLAINVLNFLLTSK